MHQMWIGFLKSIFIKKFWCNSTVREKQNIYTGRGGGGLASDTRIFDLLLGRNLHNTTSAFKRNLHTATPAAFKQQKTQIYIFLGKDWRSVAGFSCQGVLLLFSFWSAKNVGQSCRLPPPRNWPFRAREPKKSQRKWEETKWQFSAVSTGIAILRRCWVHQLSCQEIFAVIGHLGSQGCW